MKPKSRVDEALTELVEGVKAEATDIAQSVDTLVDRLAGLAATVSPIDGRLATALRSAASSLEQHSPSLRKAVEDFESKMLPGEPEPDVLPIERARSESA